MTTWWRNPLSTAAISRLGYIKCCEVPRMVDVYRFMGFQFFSAFQIPMSYLTHLKQQSIIRPCQPGEQWLVATDNLGWRVQKGHCNHVL
jgi:hypothetical protein